MGWGVRDHTPVLAFGYRVAERSAQAGIPRCRRSLLAVLTRGWHRERRPMVTGNPWRISLGILQSRKGAGLRCSR